jgi:hypothetical protein
MHTIHSDVAEASSYKVRHANELNNAIASRSFYAFCADLVTMSKDNMQPFQFHCSAYIQHPPTFIPIPKE